MAAYIFKLQVTNLSFDRRTFCTSLSSVEIHFQLNKYFTTFIVFSTSRLFIYLCTTFIKRIIHNLICSDALCMRNNVQGTFYIMFCKFMQFNKIFKTIFEYLRKKFRFVQIRFVSTEKNYAHRLACILFLIDLKFHYYNSVWFLTLQLCGRCMSCNHVNAIGDHSLPGYVINVVVDNY